MLRPAVIMRRLQRLLLLSALWAPTFAGGAVTGSEAEDSSVHLGPPPASRPTTDDVLPPAQARLGKQFDRALQALDSGRDAEAAEGFEAVLGEVEWPEASYNAALARYRLLDLRAAERHAAAAAQGLPNDALAAYLHALVLHDLARHADAVALARRAAGQVAADSDPGLLARILLTEGSALRLLGQVGGSAEVYRTARSLAERAGLPLLQASAWLGLGHLALTSGAGEQAREAFASAESLGGEAGRAARSEVALARAEAAWRAGDADEASRALSESLQAMEASGLPVLSRAGLGVRVAALQWSLGARESARRRLAAAETVFGEAGALAAAADVWVTRSAWAVGLGDLDEADRLLARAIEVQASVQVPVALASSRLARAQLLANRGALVDAFALAEASLSVFEELGFLEGQQGAWLVLAELKGRGGALADARVAALEAVSLAQGLENPRLAATARAELAVILARLGAVDQARTEYELASVRPRSGGSLLAPRSRVRLEVELAAAYVRKGESETATGHALKAVEIAAADGAPADLVPLAEEAVVAALLEGGRHDEALAFLDARSITTGKLRDAVRDRRGTQLFNEGVDAYEAGDFGLAANRFRTIVGDATSPEPRIASARAALREVLSAQGARDAEEGREGRAEEVWREASELAMAQEDLEGWATLLLLRAQLAADAGRPSDAVALAERCAVGTAQLDDGGPAARCWELAGHASLTGDPGLARRAFENALAALARVPDSVAQRAQLAYNLAVLDQEGPAAALLARLEVARSLAVEAGDDATRAEVEAWIEQLESPDEP
jgi:hypothetical protein